ncbi:MAG: MarR family transcriptional regulator [Candidatus Sumerlaeia bacterium]|nr:MarR family transcriptional regulator [Candidatus Sumerlaeia bacterium]
MTPKSLRTNHDAPDTQAEIADAVLSMVRSAEIFQYGLAQILRAKGMTPAQYHTLVALRGAGQDGLLCGAVAALLPTPVPDLTRVLDKVEARGWAVRKRDTADRRAVRVWITPAGRALLRQLETPVKRANAVLLRGLSEAEVGQLGNLLSKLREGLAADPDAA